MRRILATFENFSEEAYLLANKDVEEAVLRGEFKSGFDHFNIYGHKEKRALLHQSTKPPRYFKEKLDTISSFSQFCSGQEYPKSPLQVQLEISNVCDLKCAMCNDFSAINIKRFQELRAYERGFFESDELNAKLGSILAGTLMAQCSGYGEPTLHPDFKRLITLISDYEVMIEFITNGMHLTDDLAAFLVEKRAYRVLISFSGATPEDYEAVYLGSSFETVTNGIRALNKAKKAAGSQYPIIEINSLGFKHHVEGFDRFVQLMAECGANVIHLKKLIPLPNLAELYEHVAIYRSWAEGEVIARAEKIGRERNVIVDAGQFIADSAVSEDDYNGRIAAMAMTANLHLRDRQFGETPIRDFKRLFVQPEKGKGKILREITSGSLESAADALEIGEIEGSKGFYCMEPFKTLYVRKDGLVQPCCFGDKAAPALGSINRDSADSIWDGVGFNAIRNGILQGLYPQTYCQQCVKQAIDPAHHFGNFIIGPFLDWYSNCYTSLLESAIEFADPELFGRLNYSNMRITQNLLGASRPDVPAVTPDSGSHFEGYFEHVTDSRAVGWVWLPDAPNYRTPLTVTCGQQAIAQGVASRRRDDLLGAGKGDGYHGFSIALPTKEGGWTMEELAVRLWDGRQIPRS